MATPALRITVWGENVHENRDAHVRKLYPEGMHGAIAAGLKKELGKAAKITTATLDQPEHGLTEKVLANTDVLTWWGHAAHAKVDDAIVERVHKRVLEGMGLIVLHSGHYSKIFKKLMGTGCGLKWRGTGELERVWNVNPSHPISEGLPESFEIPEDEMYGEFFDIPQPDELVLIGWFEGGEVFRSGCTWRRGNGKVFYFQPGHETFPIYHHPMVIKVIANGCKWATPVKTTTYSLACPNVPEPASPIKRKK